MASVYPGALDTFATNKTNATATPTDHPNHHNDLADAVNKIEAELGTNPSGGAATVAAAIAAASIPSALLYPYAHIPGETGHVADDFFATYSGYTEHAPSGTATWAKSLGGLGVTFVNVAGADLAVTVKAVPAAGVPITIETVIHPLALGNNNPGFGLIFTDGTTDASNLAGAGIISQGGTFRCQPSGTLTNVASGIENPVHFASNGPYYVRLIWAAANTFAFAYSSDGDTWVDFNAADVTRTFTPTHMGFFVTNWNAVTETSAVVFPYLRVYEADLSI